MAAESIVFFPPDAVRFWVKCGLQNSFELASICHAVALSFMSHCVHRKHCAWKTRPCALTRSAAYTVLAQRWHFSPPPPKRAAAAAALADGAGFSGAGAGAGAGAVAAAATGGAGSDAGLLPGEAASPPSSYLPPASRSSCVKWGLQ